MDFVHDLLATVRKIRILSVIDMYSRFSPAVDAHFCYRGEDVVQTLERGCQPPDRQETPNMAFGGGEYHRMRGCRFGIKK